MQTAYISYNQLLYDRVEWRSRLGFARLAKDSGKPIVPMFTQNIREFSDMVTFGATGQYKNTRWRISYEEVD